MSVIQDTLEQLKRAADKSDSALVSFSGGKDSLVVADLAVRTFKRVEGFYMYLVPGMQCVEDMLAAGTKRFGFPIRQYPHFTISMYVHEGLYCPLRDRSALPTWKLMDVYALAMKEAGIDLILTGMKRSDGINRARLLKRGFDKDFLCHPIVSWAKADVTGYLQSRNIPLPSASKRTTTGIDLNVQDALWLHDTYPEDFKLLCRYFPYAESIVWRRKFYGLEE